jgi:hypothetical protein
MPAWRWREDFVYSEYLLNHGRRQKMVWKIAEDYHNATCLLRLPGYSPMPAFRKVCPPFTHIQW